MDAELIYPRGWHPVLHEFTEDNLDELAPRRSRLRVPVRYYFAGFGLSQRLDPESHSPGIVYLDGRHHRLNIPELSNRNQPIDGFKVDIYMLGQFFKETLCISVCVSQKKSHGGSLLYFV